MSTLALCPSRGRPGAAHETLRSFLATRKDPGSRLVFVVDRDDPFLAEYPADHLHVVEPKGCMGAALTTAGRDKALLADATSVGMAGDDNRFRTPGWDLVLDGWLSENIGVAYGDDGFQHERLPTSWWVSRPLLDEFGIVDPGLRHFYMDNWWKSLAEGAGCLRYFPDISIEHLHPLAGKAEDDAIYRRSRANVAHDRSYFGRWERLTRPGDVRRARAVIDRDRPRRVLADWHHPALWESLSILFEDRFRWELYSPIGAEWMGHGWTFSNGTPGWTAEDYLVFPDAEVTGDHFERTEREYPERPRKMVTWEQAQDMRWDFVLASVPVHQRAFAQLARRFGGRFIHQVGNARHPVDRSIPQVVLASANVRGVRGAITYHQEFSRALFASRPPAPHRGVPRVRSFMLRLDSTSGPFDWLADTVEWTDHGGADPRNGHYLAPMAKVANEMAGADWIWHDKRIGDGYGHVLHNAAAIGRPLIGHASHYRGLLGEPLWRDLETCIDLDRHPPERAVRLVRAITADPEWHAAMCAEMAATFVRTVNFDQEADAIRAAPG
jgi:hypothetical protein